MDVIREHLAVWLSEKKPQGWTKGHTFSPVAKNMLRTLHPDFLACLERLRAVAAGGPTVVLTGEGEGVPTGEEDEGVPTGEENDGVGAADAEDSDMGDSGGGGAAGGGEQPSALRDLAEMLADMTLSEEDAVRRLLADRQRDPFTGHHLRQVCSPPLM